MPSCRPGWSRCWRPPRRCSTRPPVIRNTVSHANPRALRQGLADSIRQFEARARAASVPNEQVIAARYVLCTLLDESASSTPWGGLRRVGRAEPAGGVPQRDLRRGEGVPADVQAGRGRARQPRAAGADVRHAGLRLRGALPAAARRPRPARHGAPAPGREAGAARRGARQGPERALATRRRRGAGAARWLARVGGGRGGGGAAAAAVRGVPFRDQRQFRPGL